MANETDFFEELEQKAKKKREPVSNDDQFIAWFTQGSLSKLDQCCGYIRSVSTFMDFVVDDEGYEITKKSKKLKKPDRIRMILKYYILSVYGASFQEIWSKKNGKPIDLDACLAKLMKTQQMIKVCDQSSSKPPELNKP